MLYLELLPSVCTLVLALLATLGPSHGVCLTVGPALLGISLMYFDFLSLYKIKPSCKKQGITKKIWHHGLFSRILMNVKYLVVKKTKAIWIFLRICTFLINIYLVGPLTICGFCLFMGQNDVYIFVYPWDQCNTILFTCILRWSCGSHKHKSRPQPSILNIDLLVSKIWFFENFYIFGFFQ